MNMATAEAVMVSYDHSEGEQANIITVAASGIRFCDRWVLTHGSIFSPLPAAKDIQRSKGKPILSEQFYDNLPEIYVTCERPKDHNSLQEHYNKLEILSSQRNYNKLDEFDHSSYQIRVLTGRVCHVWQCPVLDRCVDDILYSWTIGHRDGDIEKQTQLGKALLSVFVLIDLQTDDKGSKFLRPLSALLDLVHSPPDRGAQLEVHSTPFGCEVFLNAVTRGTVCGSVGKRPSLLLTDAATALGAEGSPVFAPTEESRNALVGMVICSVSWWRGEWVGLTLVAPLVAILSTKLRVNQPHRPLPIADQKYLRGILNDIDTTTVLIRCGGSWGTGIYIGKGYAITCAHVVKNYGTQSISMYCQGVKEIAIVRYKTSDEKAYDLALVYSNQQNWKHLTPACFAKTHPVRGDPVLAAGFPYFDENHLEDLKPTVTSGHVNNVSPSMIQTSCCVQSGFSGGAIYRLQEVDHRLKLEVVGVIVSNAKSHRDACYPYINMAVPSQAFVTFLQDFIDDKDLSKLQSIENKKDIIQSQWRLLPYRSKI